MIGEDYTAECEAEHQTTTQTRGSDGNNVPSVQAFRKQDLEHIQADIATTSRPVYSVGPPSNMGKKQQGKLKADQWKAAIEFELPVALMKHWH